MVIGVGLSLVGFVVLMGLSRVCDVGRICRLGGFVGDVCVVGWVRQCTLIIISIKTSYDEEESNIKMAILSLNLITRIIKALEPGPKS